MQTPKSIVRLNLVSSAFFALAVVLLSLIVVASWASDSRMTALRWVPGWIAAFADRDPNIRTAVPFIPLEFLLAQGMASRGVGRPLAWSMAGCVVCLGLSEFGQRFVPHRTADVKDLMWGGAGILIGAGMAWVSGLWRRS